jgi:hypothetical protein
LERSSADDPDGIAHDHEFRADLAMRGNMKRERAVSPDARLSRPGGEACSAGRIPDALPDSARVARLT